jgi:hypothetical protein
VVECLWRSWLRLACGGLMDDRLGCSADDGLGALLVLLYCGSWARGVSCEGVCCGNIGAALPCATCWLRRAVFYGRRELMDDGLKRDKLLCGRG